MDRDCYEGLAHMIMETEKCLDLSSPCWRSRKTGGVIPSKSEDLRTKGANGVNLSPTSGGDEMRCLRSSSEARKKGESLLPLPFVLYTPSMD